MAKIFFVLLILIEIFALAYRGGGPILPHLLLTGVTFCMVCAGIFFEWRRGPAFSFRFGWPHLFYLLFFLFFLISLTVGVTPEFGLSELLLFANAGILFFIFSAIRFEERDLNFLKVGLIALAVIDVLAGFFIYTGNAYPRFVGTFIDLNEPYGSFANDFADFALLILPLALAEFFRRHRRFTTTIVAGFAAAVLFTGFLLSFSRGAWFSLLGVIFIAAVWFFWHRKNFVSEADFVPARQFVIRAAAVIAITAMLVFALQFARSQKFETISLMKKLFFQADEGADSVSSRLAYWEGAIKIIQERPLFGGGALSFRYLFPQHQKEFGINGDHPHNIFLKIGVENGVLAAVFFAAFLVSIFIPALLFFRKEPRHPSFFFALGALGALAHNLIDFNFIVANFILFVVLLSFLRKQESVVPRTNVFLRPLFIISFLLVFLAFHEGLGNIDFKRGRAALAEKKTDEAIVRLESAQKLFFWRDLANYLAIAYSKKFEESKDFSWREKQKNILIEAAAKTPDPRLYSELSDWYLQADRNYELAENMAKEAIRFDPMNRFRYYHQLLEAQELQGKPADSALRKNTLLLLDRYKNLLENNKNFTILTDNPRYAAQLYRFFGERERAEEIERLSFEELVKFVMKYGKPPAVQL